MAALSVTRLPVKRASGYKGGSIMNRRSVTIGPDPEVLVPNILFPKMVDLESITVPNASVLAFVGTANLHAMQTYLRRMETDLREKRKALREDLGWLTSKQIGAILKSTGEQCDWHGSEHANMPTDLKVKFNVLGDTKGYSVTMQKRAEEVFKCRFGQNAANWCERNPQPCPSGYRCSLFALSDSELAKPKISAYENIYLQDATSIAVTACPHYDKCYGDTPIVENCIFSQSETAIEEFRNHMADRADIFSACMEHITTYIGIIRDAVQICEKSPSEFPCPRFSLATRDLLASAQNRERIIKVERIDGRFEIIPGVFAGKIKAPHNKVFSVVNTYDGKTMRFCDGNEISGYSIYFREADFTLLAKDSTYRKIWLNMIGDDARFTREELLSIFTHYRALKRSS